MARVRGPKTMILTLPPCQFNNSGCSVRRTTLNCNDISVMSDLREKSKKRPKVKAICLNCGEEFLVYRSQIEYRNGGKFCSKNCRYQYMRGENHPRSKPKIDIICETCGKLFHINQYKSKTAKYCSLDCRNKALVGRYVGEKSPVYSRVSKQCPVCGLEFTVKQSQNNRCIDNCCSKECSIQWASLSGKFCGENNPMFGIIGDQSPAWNGGSSNFPYPFEFNKQLKLDIRTRDEFKCRICGEKEGDIAFPVHHINYNRNDNFNENLILFCVSCHSKTNTNRNYWESYLNSLMIS